MSTADQTPPPQSWPRARASAVLLPVLGVALLARLLLLNEGYFDFGDGNYLYICWRMGEGARLYAEILSPQPPLHLHLGMVIIWLGDLLGNSTLTIRAVQAIVRVLTAWLVYRVGRSWGFGRGVGVLAAAIFLLSPIGDRWSLGWQSENIEIPLLLTMQILLAKRGSSWLLLAGLSGAGALLCNMTAAPYVLFTALYAVIAFRLRGLLFALGLFGGWGLVAAYFEITTGAFFTNVIGNQVGSYQSEGFWGYALPKIWKSILAVLTVQGVWTLLGFMGLVTAGVLSRRKWRDPHAIYWGIYSLGAFLSITYVSKGGTADYIFCLAEPHVALWAAWALVGIAGLGSSERLREWSPNSREFVRMMCLAMVPSLIMLGAFQASSTLYRMHSQEGYEWPEDRMRHFVTEEIEMHSEPGDLILAPPHFAYHTRRHLVEDFSSTYLWYTKWANETVAEEPGEGIAMMERIGEQIRAGEVAFIALNGLSPELVEPTANGDPVGIDAGYDNRYIARIPQIRGALLEACQRVGQRGSLTSNLYWGPSRVLRDVHYQQEELTFWVPRRDSE